jgi:predicted Holliday junction resolvase-like endonuclease
MSNAPATSTAKSSRPRGLGVVCLVLLIAITTLVSKIVSLRGALNAQEMQTSIAKQEARSLRQQLEAERMLAAAQNRLLREALAQPPAPSPATRP